MAVTVAQLRILCGDPSSSKVLSTSQYSEIIAIESNVYRAAALACRAIAATYATDIEVKAGPTTTKLQQQFEHYTKLAATYDVRAESGSSDSLIPITTGIDETDPQEIFSIGMDDFD